MGDEFGKAIWEIYTKGKTNIKLISRRDDGKSEVRDFKKYLQPYNKIETIQKNALKHAKGKVLDIGFGGGKHSIYLQQQGLKVTGIDNSPYLVKLGKKRGLKDVRRMDLFKMNFGKEKFDTLLLFGNGLCFGHNPQEMKKFLNKLYRLTTKNGIILGDSTDPRKTTRGLVAYKGRKQFKVRHEINGKFGPWFTPFFVSESQLRKIVKETRWKINKIYRNKLGDRFSVILEKR